MRPVVLLFVIASILMLSGCGGGGAGGGGNNGGPTGVTGATFQITWPARSRSAYSNPLTSALSVFIDLKGAGANKSDVTLRIDRDATKVAGYTGTYSSGTTIYPTQLSTMTATFYAQPAEGGPVVGTATASATVTGTSVQITPIALVGTIKSVVVLQPANQVLTTSSPTQLAFSALDSRGNSIAVTPGSAIWAVFSGSSFTLTRDGIATPIKTGPTVVKATVDGIASPATSISVLLPNISNATFQIAWPMRSRSLTNPLTSALSVAVVFKQASATGANVTIDIDRDSTQLAAYTGTYTIPQPINPNVLSTLSATFYAQAKEGGPVVGTASASATPSGTTVNIASIVLSGLIKHVAVIPATLTLSSGTTQLTFTTTDGSGNTVAVTPGSAIWAITSGGPYLTLTRDGIASPVAVGSAEVTATVDGISSPQTSITVKLPNISNATFQISWPTRSRSLTSPLTSALSVAVVFKQASAAGADVTMDIDRDLTQVAAYTGTYTISQPINPNVLGALTATFYAQPTEGGQVVGTATASATPSGTTVNIASIVLNGVIKNVSVVPGTLTVGGAATQLAFTTTDGSGNTVAVTPGSALWKVVSGGSYLKLTQDGIATPVAAGTAEVTATVDGISSAQGAISVNTASGNTSAIILDIDTQDIAYDATRGLVYASTMSSSSVSPLMVLPINATTGAIGTAFAVGSAPSALAVSSDGSHLFVAESGSSVVNRVSLTTHLIDATINVGASLTVNRLLAIPNAPDSFIAWLGTGSAGAGDVATIFDSGVPRPVSANLGERGSISPTGNQVCGVNQFDSPSTYYIANISPSGLTNAVQGAMSTHQTDVNITWAQGNIVVAGYTQTILVNPLTAAQIGTLPTTGNSKNVTSNPNSNRVYVTAWGPTVVQTFDVATRQLVGTPFPVSPSTQGGIGNLLFIGSNRIVYRTWTAGDYNGAHNNVVIVSNLP